MAARVLLLGILFTEVLKPVSVAAGVKGIGGGIIGKNGSKPEGLGIGTSGNSGISLEIEPGGHVVLGRKGITLNCLSVFGHDVSWLYNGVPAPPCGLARCTLLRNGSLHFYKKQNLQLVQKQKGKDGNVVGDKNHDKNEYRCIVRTSLGGLLRSSPTFVKLAELSHMFKESPEDLTVHEGEVARLSCLIYSVPFPPNITWQHNGEIVLSGQNDTKYSLVAPGVLYISATKLSDAGSYRCIVTNEFLKKTKKSKEAKLTVISRPEGKESHVPALLFPQVSYSHWLNNGSDISLTCAASGYPSPLITWAFIPRYADKTNLGQPRVLLNSTNGIGVLTLRNVSVHDAGVYLCSTKNSPNADPEIQNITVDVLVPPSFLKKPANQICPNGRTARFECQAQGKPVPRIYWLKDSENITVNGRRTTYVKEYNKIELAISATVPSDSGIYQCMAVNAAGEVWAAGRLQVNTSRNSPATSTSLKCHALSPVRIFISWEPPKSLPSASITAYTVHYSPVDGGKEEVSPPEPGNSTSVEVTKLLEPFTNYSFYVRVWNNHGASDQSATIVCSTAPSVPKTAPKVALEVVGSTKLHVSWTPLSKNEARGVVVEYKLQWRLHEHPSSRVLYLPASIEHYVLTDLIPGARYDLRVLARTEQGWPNVSESQFSWTSVTMPSFETTPFTVQNVVTVDLLRVNASTVKVRWKVDEMTSGQAEPEFDSWQVYYENEDERRMSTVLLPRNLSEYTFTELGSNNSYSVGVCMVSDGKALGCILRRVESTRINSNYLPTALEAIPVSATSINVTWSLSDVYDIDSYEICYCIVHGVESDLSECIVVDETKVTIDRLRPFTLYQFKVRALHNGTNQSSPFSETIECYTNEDIPGKVEEVQWFLSNSTNVRIAWKEPNKLNGIIQNYLVAYTMNLAEAMSTWGNVTVPGNKTSANLPGLVPGKRYFVVVQAATKAGFGKPSDPIIIITGGGGGGGGGVNGGSGASKGPTTSDKQKPPQKFKPDQSLGVILGVSISIGCIMICLCSIYCRKKCENSQSLGDSAQPLKDRILMRNGNGCCIDRSSTSVSQHANPTTVCNEIELAVLCPSSPITTNPHPDTKGGHSNGILEACAKEPLLTPWDLNGETKDLRITGNPEYKRKNSATSIHQASGRDLDSTQQTMLNCTSSSAGGSTNSCSSLNNNLACAEADTSPQKATSTSVPVLGPNG
ncbi:protogenin B isoform X2 [Orussus abietinus]|uniref:protogenin B isoform X2 n=1 Tax=Orussus abietinus TaxID=222816 RepID=UPI000626DD88|nr:protogenin B isoform X2 [Orussus abietinus]